MTHLIAPSILTADFSNLQKHVEMLNESEADWIHIDVMDGVFVPNISFGLPVLEAIKKHASKPLDVHLMITEPHKYIKAFGNAGADNLIIHMETSTHLHKEVQEIHTNNMKAGICLNPHTPVHFLEDIIHDVELVLLMTVNPGFGGQEFIPHSYDKIRKLKKLIKETGSSALIEVDGGISMENARPLIDAGVDVLVVGSSIFNPNEDNPKKMIAKLKRDV